MMKAPMRKNKGSITLYVLIAMMFFIMALIGTFMVIANRNKTEQEMSKQIRDTYAQGDGDAISQSYMGGEIAPIYNSNQLQYLISNQFLPIDDEGGKIYKFSSDTEYILKNNIIVNENEFEMGDIYNEIRRTLQTMEDKFDFAGHTITVTLRDGTQKVIKEKKAAAPVNATLFTYNGAVQTYTVPKTGKYKLQVWGAAGGNNGTILGGAGGYSEGIANLTVGETIYIYVGSKPTAKAGGFNGGGNGATNVNNAGSPSYGGGGATDMRIGTDSLNTRVIVAGGGGRSICRRKSDCKYYRCRRRTNRRNRS